jgi:cytochrome b
MLYPWHMILGFLAVWLIFWRVIWGAAGSRFSRFRSFELGPRELVKYFVHIATGRGSRNPGHNPASSWATLVFLFSVLGLGVSGYLKSVGIEDIGPLDVEEMHEILADVFIVTVAAHIIGIVIHMLRYRDGIALSMVHGKKQARGEAAFTQVKDSPQHGFAAGVGVLLAIVGAVALVRSYDPQAGTLTIFSMQLTLVERESEDE